MHEMAVDIQDGGFTGYLTHNVRIPDFIKHSFWHYLVSYYFLLFPHFQGGDRAAARTLLLFPHFQGGGKPGPYPIRGLCYASYRVRAGLAPALASRDDYTSASTAPVFADVTIEA